MPFSFGEPAVQGTGLCFARLPTAKARFALTAQMTGQAPVVCSQCITSVGSCETRPISARKTRILHFEWIPSACEINLAFRAEREGP